MLGRIGYKRHKNDLLLNQVKEIAVAAVTPAAEEASSDAEPAADDGEEKEGIGSLFDQNPRD